MIQAANLFPTAFSEELQVLTPDVLDDPGRIALEELAAMGLTVRLGLRRVDVPGIAKIAEEDPVRSYCWRDLDERFGNEEMTERWQAKARGMVQVDDVSVPVKAAYSWEGPEQCKYLPDCENTFAIRVSEGFGRRGIASRLTVVTLSGCAAVWGARKVGLETWGSNEHAVKAYKNVGAEEVTRQPGMRKVPGVGEVPDVRVYMRFPQTF
jgi:ribosomal protein S18 acetylase RimI-like enzyme